MAKDDSKTISLDASVSRRFRARVLFRFAFLTSRTQMPSIWDDGEVQTPDRSKKQSITPTALAPSATPTAKNSIWDMPACFNPCHPMYDQIAAEANRTARLKAIAVRKQFTKKWWQCEEKRMTGVWLPKLKKGVISSGASSGSASSSSSQPEGVNNADVVVVD
eukprot:6750391-Pyramimonas_sp.AAC.1